MPVERTRLRITRRTALRTTVGLAAAVFLLRPLALRVGRAADQLARLDTGLVLAGFALQVAALICYSRMTQAAIAFDHGKVGLLRLVRIQLVTRAVSSTVPAGAAAGPAIGYRLLTSSGVSPAATAAALATGSLLSAVVLNVALWAALLVSIPLHGFRALYAAAALFGVVVVFVAAGATVAITDGSRLVERAVRWLATRVGGDGDQVVTAIRAVGLQVAELVRRRRTVVVLAVWASANWFLDALSLWVFLHMFDVRVDPITIAVAFGIANVLAAVPLTPGGVGLVEWAYVTILVAVGAGLDQATLAVTGYRVAQFLFPVVLGAVAHASFVAEAVVERHRSRVALLGRR